MIEMCHLYLLRGVSPPCSDLVRGSLIKRLSRVGMPPGLLRLTSMAGARGCTPGTMLKDGKDALGQSALPTPAG